MVNTGPTKFYLSNVINYDQLAKKIHISQARYVKRIIRDFGYSNAKPVHTPMKADHKLIKKKKFYSNQIPNPIVFQQSWFAELSSSDHETRYLACH
jgi:hypothetical protein